MNIKSLTHPTPSEQLKNEIVRILDAGKAENILVIDLHGKTSIADYMIIATGSSARHVGAMAQHLLQKLKEKGHSRIEPEGTPQNDWVLVDSGDVVVHLFRPEIRTYYDLEGMWDQEIQHPLAANL